MYFQLTQAGTFMQVQETYVKVATRLFDRRRTNVTPCLLLETKALCEILNLWGGRVGKLVSIQGLLITNLQETKPPGLGGPHPWGSCI